MRRWVSIISILLPFLFAGLSCKKPAEPLHSSVDPPVVDSVPFKPLQRQMVRQNHRNFVLLVRMNVLTIRLPIGAVSRSEELWSYLDEEPVGAKISSALAMNGIRIGLGRKGDWNEVYQVLRRHTAQPLKRSVALGPAGRTMPIVFKPKQKSQTIFTYRQDITLFGRDYPPGDNVLMTAASIDYDNPEMIHVSGTFVIRSSQRRMRYVNRGGEYGIVSEPIYYRLGGLGFHISVPEGGFILIGPGKDIERPSSIGHRFLVDNEKAIEFETVVILAPEIFAAPVGGSE